MASGAVHVRVRRGQVLAYRAAVQQLFDHPTQPAGLAVLDLGVQDTPPGAAAHALANRLGRPVADPTAAGLATTWTVRGAPHVHRAADLRALAGQLWPWSDGDALARLDTAAAPVRRAGMPAREALRFVAERMAAIVTAPLPKGEVSAALTARIPAAMTVDCRVCRARHVVETLFRSAVLPAGIRFAPAQRSVTFVPMPGWPGVPRDTEGADRLVLAYLRLLGPAGPPQVAAFLGTSPAELASRWPGGLAEVAVDGVPAWLPAQQLDLLQSAPQPSGVRLLPPSDPLLQARDRELVVPDRAQREVLWPALGRPGAVLRDGEVAGSWSARRKGRNLALSVRCFSRPPVRARRALEEQAGLLARVRGAADVVVSFADP